MKKDKKRLDKKPDAAATVKSPDSPAPSDNLEGPGAFSGRRFLRPARANFFHLFLENIPLPAPVP